MGKFGHWGLRVVVALAAMAAAASFAAASDTRVTGTLGESKPSGGNSVAQFTCFGMPTCAGTVTVYIKSGGCSNGFSFTTNFVVTNLDLSHSGALSGSVQIDARQTHTVNNADGTCAYQMSGGATWPYTGSWDATGASGTMNIASTDGAGNPQPITGTFTANVGAGSPVFPMTTSGSVTPTAANVSATMQPRPEDVGSSASIFVFAHAPSNLVQGAIPAKRAGAPPVGAVPTDDAVVCVLAQVDAGGHLVAVSAATMQAYFTGVLSSQGQAVAVLNNVPTPNVAGAAVYVGYGASAASMLSSGVYQNAVSIPGAVQCTASLATAPAATAPAALSGLWWNANESGWGIQFTQRGGNVFAAWYTYDGAGNPKWYVATCPLPAGNTAGTCSGTLYEVDGPKFFGVDFNPSLRNVLTAGSLTVDFQNANNASMSYTVGSQSRTVAITRQVFNVAPTSPPAVDFTDLWWNPNESGWGMAVTHQFGNIFLAWYVYDANGKPFWYVAPGCTVRGSSCSGSLYRTTAPPFGPPLDPTKVQAFPVGSAIVSFVDANHGVLSYEVDGVQATKSITRQLF